MIYVYATCENCGYEDRGNRKGPFGSREKAWRYMSEHRCPPCISGGSACHAEWTLEAVPA